jgi:imidazolonepropionase
MKKAFHNISVLYGTSPRGTFKSGKEMMQLDTLENAYIIVEDGVILDIGTGSRAELEARTDGAKWGGSSITNAEKSPGTSHEISSPEKKSEKDFGSENSTTNIEWIDLNGAEVMPGLVDSHTHIVFASPRHEEFALRIQGATYEEIAAAGGGILNSAKKLRETSEDQLFEDAAKRVQLMMEWGTTTLEIKSGYGLSVESELKMLRVIKRLKQTFPIHIKATFLGAHAFPTEFKQRREDYIDLILRDMLPAVVADELADHIDVFCDEGFFTPEQTEQILLKAQQYGLPAKIHGNELGLTGGVQVGVKMNAWSVDHLEHCSEVEMELFRQSNGNTIPVALPGTSYFLGIPYAPTRKMIDYGLPVALATDFNPGSSPVASLQTVSALACTQMKMMPQEAFHAVTCNAARALRMENEVGCLAVGMSADFLVMKSKDAVKTIPYYLGQNQVQQTYCRGNCVAN